MTRGTGKPKALLAELTRATTIFEAQLLAGYLESEGVLARIPDAEMIQCYDGAATIWSKGVRVEVRTDDLERARELLAAWEQRKTDGNRR